VAEHFHHAHIFASDIGASVAWYRDMLGGTVMFDGEFGGARNVFMRIGEGRVYFYDQPPKGPGRGAVHHLGIRTDDLANLVARLRRAGHAVCNEIRDFGWWKYFMCAAPDGILLELFEVDAEGVPEEVAAYFQDPSGAPLTA